jgi:sulfatase modifying factor 1
LDAVEKLESGGAAKKGKKRLPLIIGVVVLIALVPLGMWIMNQKTGKTNCTEAANPYTIVVADFMQENPAFARRVVTNLLENFPVSQNEVGISPLGRFLDPLKAKVDTFDQVVQKNCVEKGIILYGTLDELGGERLFNGFIKLEGLKDASIAAEKVSVEQVVLTNESNLKVPDEINFSISEQARLVSDFTTGLLKYYLGDTTAIAFFQKAIQTANPAKEEKLKDVANLYLGNTYLAAGKAEKALETYDQISEVSPIKTEITWNQSVAHLQLKQFDEAARGFAAYAKIQPLQPKDTLVIREMKKMVEATLPQPEAEAILAPVVAVIPQIIPQEKHQELAEENTTETKKPEKKELTEEDKPAITEKITTEIKAQEDTASLVQTEDKPTDIQREKTEEPKPEQTSDRDQTPGPKMIKITGGTFEMGDDTYTRHQVTLNTFYLSETEITNAQYAAFLNQAQPSSADLGKWIKLASSKIELNGAVYQAKSGYENHPVVYVSWYGATAYCDQMGYRLPTEAEWEYAAGGGASGRTKWAGTNDENTLSQYGVYKASGTAEVKSKKKNRLGLYDMSGNVYEWCQDWYDSDYYQTCLDQGVVNNPKGPSGGTYRVLRGGSWYDNHASYLRVSRRLFSNPSIQHGDYGFRVARTR